MIDDDFLLQVPIFAGLPDEVRRRVSASMEPVVLRAGAWLFRQGDPGDAMFVVRSGRLHVLVDADGERRSAGTMAPGEVLGELALLTGGRRAASVRALRRTELLRLDRRRFDELLHSDHAFAVEIARLLGRRLGEGPPKAMRRPSWRVAGLVPLSPDLPVRRIAEALAIHPALGGRVGLLHMGHVRSDERAADWMPRLDAAEEACPRVLVCPDGPPLPDSFGEFAAEQADRVVVLLDPDAAAPMPEALPEAVRGADLIVLGASAKADVLASCVARIRPRAIHWIDPGARFSVEIGRAARRIAGRAVGVVLAGGGARGFAHVGALEALAEAGIEVDHLGGTSMGAFVAGMGAMGLPGDEMRETCRREMVRRNPWSDYSISRSGLLRGNKAREMLRRVFGDALIESLRRGFYCMTADLISAREVVHRRGSLAEAVGASMSIPGVFAPRAAPEGLLVDGGVLNNLPVDVMEEAGEGPIIAVDFDTPLPVHPNADPNAKPLDIPSTMLRCLTLAAAHKMAIARGRADVVILPEVGHLGITDWKRCDEIVEAGRRAAQAAIERCRAVAGG